MAPSGLRDVLGSLFRVRRRAGPADGMVGAASPIAQSPPPAVAIESSGVVVHDYDVSDQYPGAVRRPITVFAHTKGVPQRDVTLNVFEPGETAVSTIYLPIDLANGRLFVNQTYEGVLRFWGPRPQMADGRYQFRAEGPEIVSRRVVVIGGPIDGNYYHWMLNWLSRVAILKMLRPDILADPDVALFMDWRAKVSPFIEFLHGIGIGEERIVWADHTKDYRVMDTVLVSFGNQHATAPAVVETLREMFGPLGRGLPAAPRPRRLFISRQDLGRNRRRIHNIDEVRPVLTAYGLEEVTLEGRPIAEQIALFQGAEFIASVHGAGLTNIIFSPPHCRVLALDSSVHIKFGAAIIYQALAKACGLVYRSMRARRAPLPEGVDHNLANMHNQDLIVSVDELDALLRDMLGAPETGSPEVISP